MKCLNRLVFVLLVSGFSSAVFAGSESGFYVGGSLGSSNIDYSDSGVDFDDDDTGYKLFAGFNLGIIPLLDFAVEGGYVDFGSADGDVANLSADVDALSLAALLGFNLGPVGLFAKAGLASWDGDLDSIAGGDSESGTDPLYGLGAKLQFGSFGVRAEYEYFDFDNFEVDFISVGATYTF